MLRFLTFLMGKPYEVCRSCATLKEQLEYERAEKRELTATLLGILKPAVAVPDKAPEELRPLNTSMGTFARRRAALEERDRIQAKILAEKKHLGVPDNINKPNVVITDVVEVKDESIERLEKQLDIAEG